jgi:imidazolonepropionase-like amidohydrolase
LKRHPLLHRWAILALAATASSAAWAQNYALTNARVETGDGTVIDNGMVVVRDGRIASVGPMGTPNSGAQVIDLKGKTVYPGFIDAFARGALKVPEAPALPVGPSTTEDPPISFWSGNRRGVRAEVDASKILDPEGLGVTWFNQGVTAANLAGPAGTFSGVTAVFFTGGKPEAALVKADISQNVSFAAGGGGGGFGGGGGGGYPSSVMGRAALIRQLFYDAAFQDQRRRCIDEQGPSMSGDPVIDSLIKVTRGGMPVSFSASTEREIARSFMLADEFKFHLILVGAKDAWRDGAEIKKRGVPVILDVNPGEAPDISDREGAPPKEYQQERIDVWRDGAMYAVKLNQAGVPFAWSGGAARSGFLDNVRRHIEFGLPREVALAALTTNAARALGLESQLGTVSAGKTANLTIMDGDFAKKDTKVTMVFVNGEKFEVGGGQ